MEFLKKVNAVFLCLAILLAFGCKKEEVNEPALEDWSRFKCKVTESGGSPFIYDAAGNLVRTSYASMLGDSSHEEMVYNAAGNIVDHKYFNNKGEVLEHLMFTYNAANLPDTLFYEKKSLEPGFKKYEYNAEGRLSKITYFIVGNPEAGSYAEISYPAPDQSLQKDYYRSGNGWAFSFSTLNYYDNKNHPYSHLGFYSVGLYNQDLLISKHNILKSQEGGRKSEWRYEYNDQGYPTYKSLSEPGPASFPSPYGSLGGGVAILYSYNCQ